MEFDITEFSNDCFFLGREGWDSHRLYTEQGLETGHVNNTNAYERKHPMLFVLNCVNCAQSIHGGGIPKERVSFFVLPLHSQKAL